MGFHDDFKPHSKTHRLYLDVETFEAVFSIYLSQTFLYFIVLHARNVRNLICKTTVKFGKKNFKIIHFCKFFKQNLRNLILLQFLILFFSMLPVID